MESAKGRLELWISGLVMVGLALGGLSIGGVLPGGPTEGRDEGEPVDERSEPPAEQTMEVDGAPAAEQKPTPSKPADVASKREYVPKSQRLTELPPGAVPIQYRNETRLIEFLREEPSDDAVLEAAFGGLEPPPDAGSTELPQP